MRSCKNQEVEILINENAINKIKTLEFKNYIRHKKR